MYSSQSFASRLKRPRMLFVPRTSEFFGGGARALHRLLADLPGSLLANTYSPRAFTFIGVPCRPIAATWQCRAGSWLLIYVLNMA